MPCTSTVRVRAALALVLFASAGSAAVACDLCAIYSASQAQGELGRGFLAGVAEQFTHYGTLQQDGHEIPNPADQFLDSSITQVLFGYNFTERAGLQLNAPVIYRSFRRPEGMSIDRGTESGLGDLSILANYLAFVHEGMNSTATWNILVGLKFPTGSTSRLAEETHEEPPVEGEIPSAIHGHDLTLGSGSYDGILGTSVFARWNRFFATANVQYAIRSSGDFGYQFADDLIWSGGPGYYVLLKHKYTIALQAVVSGETKGRDSFQGSVVEDTGITAVYLGPQVMVTWREKLSAQLGLDLPVTQDNTALQIVPDYRVRAGATWRF